jgi:DNA-binding beta-propeller fold protein YncE
VDLFEALKVPTPGDSMTRTFPRLVGLAATIAFFFAGCASQKPAAPPDTAAAFWPPYPDSPRVQFLVSYQKSTDIAPTKSKLDELVYGKEPDDSMYVNKPYGVAMWNGRIYICDIRNYDVSILDVRNKQTLVMGKTGSEQLLRPVAIAIADDGTKYVADLGRGLVLAFNAKDQYVATLGHSNLKPVCVATYGDELYVSDFAGQRIEVLNRFNGQLVRVIGGPGAKDGQFMKPLGIATDLQGNVYVADVLRCRIQKFDRQGKLVMAFGTVSNKAGGIVRPKHIAVDKDGVIYVVDAAFQNVQLFDQTGKLLTFFGSSGPHPGGMFLPAGIALHSGDMDLYQQYIHPAFDAEQLVLVTNQFGENKVSVYAIGHLKQGKTVQDIAASKGLVPEGTGDIRGPAQLSATQQSVDDPTSAPTTNPSTPQAAAKE